MPSSRQPLFAGLLPEPLLVLFPQLLVNLGSLGGLVAVCPGGESSILLALPVLERLLLTLVLALLLAFQLVSNGSLILWCLVSESSSPMPWRGMAGWVRPCRKNVVVTGKNLLES
jgi:hypothetical protein